MRSISLILIASLLISCVPTTTETQASKWIRSAPTYSFDGSDLTQVDLVEENENSVYTFTFKSSHAGFGDRTNEDPTEIETQHTIVVTIKEEKVNSAIIDGQWNEIVQQPIAHDVAMEFSLMQCQQTPWQEWYDSGAIQFIKEPKEKEIVLAYFGERLGILAKNFERVDLRLITCQACDICPTGTLYHITVESNDVSKLLPEGWKAIS